MHNKPANLYVLMCRDTSTDSSDGMNSISKIIDKFTFGVNREKLMEKIRAENKPIMAPANFSIATSWYLGSKTKDTTKAEMRIAVLDSKGNNLGGPQQNLEVPAGSDRVNINVGVRGFPLFNSGLHLLTAALIIGDQKLYGEYPFEVVIEDAANPDIKK